MEAHAAKALYDGAIVKGYGPLNWRENPIKLSTYYAALGRHIKAWYDGEDVDPKSGVEHLEHALACLAIVLDAKDVGMIIDDRPVKGGMAKLIEQWSNK
jgi:hypothetical protein